jgi:AbiU2
MTIQSAEETKKRYVSVMGKDVGETFHALMQDAAFLHLKWNEYVKLFGRSESRVTTLNQVAPGFFWLVQEAWWDDLILHLYRLIDTRKDVMSVYRLERLLKSPPQGFTNRLAQLVKSTEFVLDVRHRHIAHRNMDLALKHDVKPLTPVSRERIRSAITAVDDVLQCVNHHFTGSEPTMYDHLDAHGGADSLLWYLQRGLAARDADYAAKRAPMRFSD